MRVILTVDIKTVGIRHVMRGFTVGEIVGIEAVDERCVIRGFTVCVGETGV